MDKKWHQATVQKYIDDKIQESLVLEYKAAGALEQSYEKKKEITKDISALANSAGGIIIYGIKEYDAQDKKFLPEKIDPIEQNKFSKEWLEQVISNIRPKIDGLVIYPVPLDTAPNHVVYIVEVPQSATAHQATDRRYYKRFNFESVAMEDYEIRDVMGRLQHPKITLEFEIHISTGHFYDMPPTEIKCTLKILAKNIGKVYAHYVNGLILLPFEILPSYEIEILESTGENVIEENGQRYFEWHKDNTIRDVIDLNPLEKKYGPSRFSPILPEQSQIWTVTITDNFEQVNVDKLVIKWSTFADNAHPNYGIVEVKDIRVIDHRVTYT